MFIHSGNPCSSSLKFHLQVAEFEHLSPLKHLSNPSIHGNPVSELPHCQGFVMFCARSLDVLDGEAVTEHAREVAITRFTKGEAARL
jgi:hypothetical protein